MERTAVVINAGLGSLSLGLKMTGFKIAAAFEPDEKAARIHMSNLDITISNRNIPDINPYELPAFNLFAARLLPTFDSSKSRKSDLNKEIYCLTEILAKCRPCAFLLFFSNRFAMRMCLDAWKINAVEGYSLFGQEMNISQVTGMPVQERLSCIVGFSGERKQFEFPTPSVPVTFKLEKYLQFNEAVNPWYYAFETKTMPIKSTTPGMYCWRNQFYEKADAARWNYIKIPLVWDNRGYRRITHREIANLKAFPSEYRFPDNKDRQWLYKKLMYSENIAAVKNLVNSVVQTIEPGPWQTQSFYRGTLFEDLFYDYLKKTSENEFSNISVERDPIIGKNYADFVVVQNNKTYVFELKWYNKKELPDTMIYSLCVKQERFVTSGIPVLVLSSVVSSDLKEKCFNKYNVIIWDISNLLWLFNDFPEIKNELIAALGYTVDDIVSEPPAHGLFLKAEEKRIEEQTSLEQRLKAIVPGKNTFREYEDVCIDILKYTLGDYLTLWKKQEKSSDGLYRFDLCCKIKSGVNQDFFQTIKNYFNTKYIVFEFKNYNEQITQKEIYTTEKYLYEKALRKVAVIISRTGADENALKAVRGCLRETGKLIICLSDNSLLDMIKIKEQGEREPAELLDTVLDDILVHLEK